MRLFCISHLKFGFSKAFFIRNTFINRTRQYENLIVKYKNITTSSNVNTNGESSASEKKDFYGPYPAAYNPKDVETGLYEYWENLGIFKSCNEVKRPFSMVLPPPNITGNLHLGHTLTVTIQDALCRWHRMTGKSVLWIPGYDHGGIATQAVVEKKIMKEKQLTRHQLGRQALIKEINHWKTSTANTIDNQLKRLGASLDFGCASFTLDYNTSNAVRETFIRLFDENLIYRKEKMVNWSCAIQSVISDIEVDSLEIPGSSKLRVPGLPHPVDVGFLEYFYYPLDNSDDKVLISTTRLETMLGDVALAVHPNDSRYFHLIGQHARHPFSGDKIPIIADEMINRDFGTGVMKVTPAHDFKDHELGAKHNLPLKEIIENDGTLKRDIKIFGGMHRFEARSFIRKHLEDMGLYSERKSHPMSLPVCSRTGDIVEPRLKNQWYLNCTDMGTEAVKAVEDGRLKLIPDYHSKLWFEWFKKLQDWCISRQLWWGHQIPAFLIHHSSLDQTEELWVAARSVEDAIQKAAQKLNVSPETISAVQDEDVLDTWFSSALFPLTALKWPITNDDLKRFYPLSLMETGSDILFFWVARMAMLCNHLSGTLPFNQVFLHGMICDSHGRKMTKSLGNVIDPSDVINGISLKELCERTEESFKHGNLTPEETKLSLSSYSSNYPAGIPECSADALRFSLLMHDVTGQKISLDVKDVRICRHFCNKIWQGVRLFTKVIESSVEKSLLIPFSFEEINVQELNEVDRWILSRLSRLVSHANKGFEQYEFHTATFAMRQFWVQNFCDIYLEYVKPALQSADDRYRLFLCRLMLTCIEAFLRVISPVMPFLSEELYQRISHLTNLTQCPTVTTKPYPNALEYSVWRNTELEADINTVVELVNICRSLKTQHGATKMKPKVTMAVESEEIFAALNRFGSLISTLGRLDSVTFHVTQGREFFEHQAQDSWVFREHEHGISVIMEMDQLPVSSKTSESKVDGIREELNKLCKMMSDSGYRKKAPLSVQEKHLAKKASLESELQKYLVQYSKSEPEINSDNSVTENQR